MATAKIKTIKMIQCVSFISFSFQKRYKLLFLKLKVYKFCPSLTLKKPILMMNTVLFIFVFYCFED